MNRPTAYAIAGISTFSILGLFSGKKTETTTSTNLPVPGGPSGVPDPVTNGRVNPGAFFKHGFPGPVHDLSNRQEYISCYNRQTRNPYWVLEHITKDSIRSNRDVDRKKSYFKEDESIPTKFRALLRDYFRSGFDRGHNAPAADAKFNQGAMNETFVLTNISPQVGEGFNRDYWAHLEDFCRRLTRKYESVRIVTGPLYLPKKFPDGKFRVVYEVIGNPPNVAVPTHFFKLVVGETNGELAASAFVLPNDRISNDEQLTSFQVPIESLERSSGLEFFKNTGPVKDLCGQVECSIIVREFNNQIKQSSVKALPAK